MNPTTETMLPFTAPRTCPQCDSWGQIDRYGEYLPYTRTQTGQLEPAPQYGVAPQPHLIVQCQTCRYEWVIRTANAASEGAQTPASGPEPPG